MRQVLVADDDADALALIKRYLEPLAIEMDVAFSGSQALDKLRDHRYDLVISDVRMPNGTGIDLLREMKTLKENLPIILISGETVGAKAQAKALGAEGFLPKPLVRADFTQMVESLIGPESEADDGEGAGDESVNARAKGADEIRPQ